MNNGSKLSIFLQSFCILAALLLIAGSVAFAQEKEAPKAKPIELPVPSVTSQSLKIDGDRMDYTATVGYFVQKEENGNPLGYMFYTAYVIKGRDSLNRPLTFCFNGGPGSSSIYLHMLTIGPKRAVLDEDGNTPGPPPRMVDNVNAWLPFTDLVFIDPIGTGFSFPHPEVDTEKFWGAEADARSVADFIRMYLTESSRWLSPIFIAGESYGGVRGALLVEELQQNRNIKLNVNGIIFISPAYEYPNRDDSKFNSLYLSQFFPTYATTARYHQRLSPELQQMDFDSFVTEVVQWATTDYLIALNMGDKLTESEKREIAATMSRYTGLDEQYILQQNLRITSPEFREKLLADQNISLDRLDARFETGAYELTTTLSPLLNHYIRVDLGFDNPNPYVVSGNVRPWFYTTRPNGFSTVPNLSNAMHNNRRMKVLVTAGYYDYACPFTTIDYALDRLLLKQELRENVIRRYYHTGHMVYTPSKELVEFTNDARKFIVENSGHDQ